MSNLLNILTFGVLTAGGLFLLFFAFFLRDSFLRLLAFVYVLGLSAVGYTFYERDLIHVQSIGYILLIFSFFVSLLELYKLRSISTKRDYLTAVLNREGITKRLEYEIEKCKALKLSFTLLLIDLDNFKQVNDTYGHSAGDHVLKAVGYELSRETRKQDAVGRWGGDEFVVLFSETPCHELLERIARISEKTFNYNSIVVGMSVGYACFPQDGKSVEELIKVADERMYKIKKLVKGLKPYDGNIEESQGNK